MFLENKYVSRVFCNKNSLLYDELQYRIEFVKKNARKRMLIKCIENVTTLADTIEVKDNHNIFLHKYSTITTSVPFNTALGQKLKKAKDPNLVLNSFLDKHNALDIYTDGSKILNSKYVGSACVVPKINFEICKSINQQASVFTAECIALNPAIDIALLRSDQDTFIFSVSLSALQSLYITRTDIYINPYILKAKAKYNTFKLN